MHRSTLFTPLAVVAGLVSPAAPAAPVPPPAIAAAQLRAINHRFVDAFVVDHGEFIERLTHEDFLLTAYDGVWHERASFLKQMRAPALTGASYDDVRVRLFGAVALVHGLFEGVAAGGSTSRVRYTDVYVWNGADWRLVNGQNTRVRADTPLRQQSATVPAHKAWRGTDPLGDDLTVLRLLNEQYVNAFREADVGWYDAHLADDYVVISGDGSFHDRAAALANFARPTFATSIASFPVDKVSIRRFDDVALIHAENAYALKDGRRGISRYTDIWVKRDGRWLCVAAQITVHRAPS